MTQNPESILAPSTVLEVGSKKRTVYPWKFNNTFIQLTIEKMQKKII
jgi:hypothetical protein